MITTKQCLIPSCDFCGRPDEQEFIIHWDDAYDAYEAVKEYSEWMTDGIGIFCSCTPWQLFVLDEDGDLDWEWMDQAWEQLLERVRKEGVDAVEVS